MKKGFRIAALALMLAGTARLQAVQTKLFTPVLCGDYCYTEGDESSCQDRSGPVWVRTMCTCINGHWTC